MATEASAPAGSVADNTTPGRHPSMKTTARRRWLVAGAAVLGIVVLVVVLALVPRERASPTPRPEPGSAAEALPPGSTALFIGDSYSFGVGVASNEQRWTSLVSADLGWVEQNRALGGTGYLQVPPHFACRQPHCPRYADQLQIVAAQGLDPDVVVIAGGQNDASGYTLDPAAGERAITRTYRRAATLFPSARVIGVGPSWPTGNDPLARRMDRAVATAVHQVGGTHISLLDPPVVVPAMVQPDRIHVGPGGHRAIADRVLAGLRSAPPGEGPGAAGSGSRASGPGVAARQFPGAELYERQVQQRRVHSEGAGAVLQVPQDVLGFGRVPGGDVSVER